MIHTITVSDLIWFRPTTQKMKALTKKKRHDSANNRYAICHSIDINDSAMYIRKAKIT
jgi:hypothetical protein